MGRLKEGVGTGGGRTVAQEPAPWFLGMTSLCFGFAPLEILGVTFAVNYGRRRGSNVRASHKSMTTRTRVWSHWNKYRAALEASEATL